jgi:hypothetical protein
MKYKMDKQQRTTTIFHLIYTTMSEIFQNDNTKCWWEYGAARTNNILEYRI